MGSRFLHKYLPAAALLAALWLGLRYLLPLLRPFLLAALLALCAEPLVRVLERRLKLRRGAAAGIGVSISLLIAVLLLVTLCAFLLRELKALAGVMPDLEDTAATGIASMEHFFLNLAGSAPDSVSPLLTRSVENLFSESSQVLDQVGSRLLEMASDILKSLPDSALGLGTWILACYMVSARLPQIKAFLGRQIPARWKAVYLPALKKLRHTLAGWLAAQCKLALITFGILSAGFLLLQIRYAPLWAALISLADALPVLGTGTVLVPWSFVSFLQGNRLQAVGLLGIYIAVTLMRSILEPKFIGKQLGLDPLVTLMALYTGYRIWGLPGMLLAPLLAVAVSQLVAFPGERQGGEAPC